MNSVKRRGGGKPNRGGGRGRGNPRNTQPPSQPNPAAIPRKAGGRDFDPDDLAFLLGDESFLDDESDDEWVMEDYEDEDYVPKVNKSVKDLQKPPEKRKVEIQILHMSDQSQQNVIQMLKEIHGSQYKMKGAESYVDVGQRIDKRFWIQDRLKVTSVMDFSQEPKAKEEPSDFALKKLESYGFHKSRCTEALSKHSDDFGLAFESLMSEMFDLNFEPVEDAPEDIEDQKNDEKLAIQSIYGDEALIEKIPGKLWELQLNLPALIDILIPSVSSKSSKKGSQLTKEMLANDKQICRFFLRGHCKFGKRCNKKHVSLEKETIIDDSHLKAINAEEQGLFLEIRYPDKCQYPLHPPLVAFQTAMKSVPRQSCLKITSRLMKEAKISAQDHVPSVFSLIGLLEDNAEMKSVLSGPDLDYSYAVGLEPHSDKPETSGQNKLFSSLGISSESNSKPGGKSSDPVLRKSRNNIRDNEKIVERFNKKVVNKTMQKTRQSLPAWNEKDNIIQELSHYQVLVVSGMTGKIKFYFNTLMSLINVQLYAYLIS